MRVDRLVRGGLVVLPECESARPLDVAIVDGRVHALVEPRDADSITADVVNPVDGCLVTPGAIDPHVHVHWPFLDARTADDYASASRAAAAGGTTSIIDFALEGRERPLDAVARRRAQAEGASVIDFGFHLVVSEASEQVLADLPEVVDGGVTSFKCYMTYRRRGLAVTDRTLYEVCRAAAGLGAAVGVHAENADLDELGVERAKRDGRSGARHLPDAKGPLVEAEAISRAAAIAAETGARLWILHLSSAEGLAAATEARRRLDVPTALETCPQYLFLDRRVLEGEHGHRYLCSPPLRAADSPPALMDALQSGAIEWVGTDHCCFTTDDKDSRSGSFWDCPHGMPGVETRPRLLLAAALEGRLSMWRAVEALSTSAARFFGLYPRKGTLLPGADADLAVWSTSAFEQIQADSLLTPSDWTPFEGRRGLAPPSLVLVRGVPVAGSAVAPPDGHGRYLRRAPLALEAAA